MANFSSLIPKSSLKRAISRATGNLTAPLSQVPAARSLFTGGGCYGGDEIYGEPGMFSHFTGIRKHNSVGNAGVLTRSFHHLLGVNQTNKPAFLWSRSMSYQLVADSHVSPRRDVKAEDEQDVDLSNKEHAERPRKHQTREKDEVEFLVDTLLDIEDDKEAVYGALDAWVAWEKNFPIARLKRVIAILKKEHQWHRIIQVIKWILSKGQGNTMGTYGQLIQALDMDRRPKEAHAIWQRKIGINLHSVPRELCVQMIRIYFRNNMLQELVKLFKDLESYDRKPAKQIVKSVADAYELLGMVAEKERILTKYSKFFLGGRNPEATEEDAATAELQDELKENTDSHQEPEETPSEQGA